MIVFGMGEFPLNKKLNSYSIQTMQNLCDIHQKLILAFIREFSCRELYLDKKKLHELVSVVLQISF